MKFVEFTSNKDRFAIQPSNISYIAEVDDSKKTYIRLLDESWFIADEPMDSILKKINEV